MRLAIPHWQDRVSPVFDVAGSLFLIDLDRNGETNRQSVFIDAASPLARVKCIVELNVDALICGAISKPLELALVSAGVEVIAQTCGNVDQVFNAYMTDQLQQKEYSLPGCSRRRKHPRSKREKNGASPSNSVTGNTPNMVAFPAITTDSDSVISFDKGRGGGFSNHGGREMGSRGGRMRGTGKGSGGSRKVRGGRMRQSAGRVSSPPSTHTTSNITQNDGFTVLNKEIKNIIPQIPPVPHEITHMQKNQHVVATIDQKQCVGCGICSEVCQADAIGLETGFALIDEDVCTGCGECVDACSMEAIHLA